MIAEDVVLGVDVARSADALGVDEIGVIPLDKGILSRLPVAGQLLAGMDADVPVRHVPIAEVIGQPHLRLVEVREIPRAGHVDQIALEAPGPPMIGAVDCWRPARTLLQLRSAVEATVVIGTKPACLVTNDDDRVAPDLMDMEIAGVGDVLVAAGELPDTAPHSGHLEISKGLTCISFKSYWIERRKGVFVNPQDIGHASSVSVQDHLIGWLRSIDFR
jgi:hypothetical protein